MRHPAAGHGLRHSGCGRERMEPVQGVGPAADGFDGVISVEFVSAPEVLEKGWDLRAESARLKEILEEALAAA